MSEEWMLTARERYRWMLTARERYRLRMGTGFEHDKLQIATAKAEAHKLVEWLEEKGDYLESGGFYLDVQDWQALRKELGLRVKDA